MASHRMTRGLGRDGTADERRRKGRKGETAETTDEPREQAEGRRDGKWDGGRCSSVINEATQADQPS